MLISACKTYTRLRRCAHAEIPEQGCQAASAWPDSVKLMKSVMGYQRAELDICGGGTPPVYGETHWSVHTIAVCQTKRIAGGVQMVPQNQNNRWIGTFLWRLPSPCTLFTAGNMRWQNFLPDRQTGETTSFDEWNIQVRVVSVCQVLSSSMDILHWWQSPL